MGWGRTDILVMSEKARKPRMFYDQLYWVGQYVLRQVAHIDYSATADKRH